MWDIYDELIAQVPPDLTVEECLVGLHWSLVRTRGVVGVAMTYKDDSRPWVKRAGRIAGMSVRELAEGIKSWDYLEAALGLAAINSCVNLPGRVALSKPGQTNAFTYLREEVRGKRVAVIGHFPGLEDLTSICHLSVLERRPREGDLPDPACEYILPEQDYVFITATALINKTLPRLLELSREAFVTLVGPSTPLTPVLFRYGIDLLGGIVVTDPVAAWRVAQEGGIQELFQSGGQMIVMGSREE
jgi:uncharacterized protein (DUF4213/DUF364 family)